LVVPLAFGAVGSAFGFAPVFVSCSALMLGGSSYGFWVERRSVRPGTSVHKGP
jgi:hypothetical protein